MAETLGGLIHAYIEVELGFGREAKHLDVIQRHREAIIARHQHILEHPMPPDRLDRIEVVGEWMGRHL